MNRIAQAGVAKMLREGYTYKQDKRVKSHFWVTKPEGRTYCVVPEKQFCNCAFHIENRKRFGKETTCKHLQFIHEEEEQVKATEAAADLFEYYEGDKEYRADAKALRG
jgi:predicted nucleic acid-binding Zn finger protein